MIKYWGNYIGGTDDSLTLADYLYGKDREIIPLSEIFVDTGLDQSEWDFHTSPELGYIDTDGLDHDFYYAIDLVTDLAALLLECNNSGRINLNDLFEDEDQNGVVYITATAKEYSAIDKALADFVQNPLSYDLHELVSEEDMLAMAKDCESVRKELAEGLDILSKDISLPDEFMITRFFQREDFFTMAFGKQIYKIIGKDEVGNFVGVASDGAVFLLDTAVQNAIYIAKSLEAFSKEIQLYLQYGETPFPDEPSEKELEDQERHFREALIQIDEKVCFDERTYWAGIVEEMREGLI